MADVRLKNEEIVDVKFVYTSNLVSKVQTTVTLTPGQFIDVDHTLIEVSPDIHLKVHGNKLKVRGGSFPSLLPGAQTLSLPSGAEGTLLVGGEGKEYLPLPVGEDESVLTADVAGTSVGMAWKGAVRVQEDGVLKGRRGILNLKSVLGIPLVTATDNVPDKRVDLQIPLGVDVQNAGSLIGSRRIVNLTGAAGAVFSTVDNAGAGRVDVQIPLGPLFGLRAIMRTVSYVLSFGNTIQTIVYDGTNLIVAAGTTLVKVSTSGAVILSNNVLPSAPKWLEYDGFIWASCGGTLVKIDPSNLTSLGSVTVPEVGNTLYGIACDPITYNVVWVASASDGVNDSFLRAYNRTTLAEGLRIKFPILGVPLQPRQIRLHTPNDIVAAISNVPDVRSTNFASNPPGTMAEIASGAVSIVGAGGPGLDVVPSSIPANRWVAGSGFVVQRTGSNSQITTPVGASGITTGNNVLIDGTSVFALSRSASELVVERIDFANPLLVARADLGPSTTPAAADTMIGMVKVGDFLYVANGDRIDKIMTNFG